MEKEQKRNFWQGVQEKTLSFALSQAVFWGKPNWAERIGKRMRLPEKNLAITVVAAYLSAGDREEVIHGNHQRAAELRDQAIKKLQHL